MQIETSTVKGFQDFLPPESLKREAVQKVIEKYFKLYGFLPVETPVVEFDELMQPDVLEGEDEAISDRFRLKDRAGRNLGLRYEFTFQLARILKQNPNIKLPFRRYQIGPIFRDEPISQERFRQFTQCDIDIIGDPSIQSETECLAAVLDILKELKINAEIQINNKKLLNSIIESVEIKSAKEVMRELDKKDKIGEDAVKINLKKYADSNQIITLFKLLEKNLAFFKENAFNGAKEIEDLQLRGKKYGLVLKLNPFMIRGFSYYTNNIFEVVVPGKGSLAGGGRYNKTVGKYIGKEIPAVGISFGLDRVAQLANIAPMPTKVIIISLAQDNKVIKLARKLRESNVSCIPSFEKVGKALEYANAIKIPYAVFIGENEVKKERFKLKNMNSGNEMFLTEKQLIKRLVEED